MKLKRCKRWVLTEMTDDPHSVIWCCANDGGADSGAECQLCWTEGSLKFCRWARSVCLAHIRAARVGVTTSGFGSQHPGWVLSNPRVGSRPQCQSLYTDRGGHPSGRMLLLIGKTKARIVKADSKGTGWRGAHGWRTQDNRINHIKNVTQPHKMEFLLRDEAGFKKLRKPCITWGLFIWGINS